ncbi:unnamed protein product [Moneuplotes crassus]|uniref:Thioredoxin domain-containing protein n=1 Tax=Euplotes crassus TaxID=5936 RepID=A0AAD1Y4V2_EUPCR|nr:unnamed protein product [Moneuplotes crassus]
MAGKQQKEFIKVLESQEDFDKVRDRDYPKCVVVDVHLTWCGPCEVMVPNFRTMFFSYDDADERLEIYTMDSSLFEDEAVKEQIGEVTCKPKFIVIIEGEIKGVIEGADFTKLFDLVDKHIPSLDQD